MMLCWLSRSISRRRKSLPGFGAKRIADVNPKVDLNTWEPSSESTKLYEDVFEVTESCTIKAIGLVNGNLSPVAFIQLTKEDNETPGAVSSIGIEEAPVRLFDLTGHEVTGEYLPAGVYIRVKGSKADKILLR